MSFIICDIHKGVHYSATPSSSQTIYSFHSQKRMLLLHIGNTIFRKLLSKLVHTFITLIFNTVLSNSNSCAMRPHKQTRSDTSNCSTHSCGFPIILRSPTSILGYPGWNPTTNIFLCPVSGYYVFTLSLHMQSADEDFIAYLYKNDQRIGEIEHYAQ